MYRPICRAFIGLLGVSAVLSTVSADELEEVVVTAQRRAQNLQEVPVAIDVYSGDTLAQAGVVDLDDLSQISSSYSINSSGGSAQPFIRGIGSNVLGNGAYASVATYIDGAYIPRGYSLASGAGSLMGIESIQVLKGPQGSLYGRNATGGAIVITTRTPHPDDDLGGSVQATFGDFGVKRGGAMVYGGNKKNFAGLFAADVHKSDGYIEGLGGTHRGDFDDEDGYSLKAKLVFEPTEAVEFVLSGSYTDDKQSTLGFQQVGQFDNTNLVPGLNGPQVVYLGALSGILGSLGLPPDQAAAIAFPAAANVRFSNEHAATFDNQVSGFKNGLLDDSNMPNSETGGGWYEDLFLTFKANVEFDGFDLVSTTAYNDHKDTTTGEVFRADPATTFDFTTLNPALAFLNTPNLGFSAIFDTDAWSQEFYLISNGEGIEWIGGVYYFTEEGTTVLTGDAFGTSSYVADNKFKNESIAGFAEATIPFAERWRLTVGARYTKEKNELDDRVDPGNPLNQAGLINVGDLDQDNNKTTYNLKLAYQADTWMAYAGASSGFKSGALNTNNPIAGAVSPEKIDAFEVGFKSQLFNERVRLNGAAFVYKYDNIQLNVLEVSSGANFLVDGVEADLWGLELEVQARVQDNLTLFLNTTYMDTEYKSNATITPLVGPPTTQLIKGNTLTMTPDAVVIAGFDYRFPFVTTGELSLNASVNHNTGFWIDQANTFGSGGDDDDAFTTANAALMYAGDEDRYSISIWVDNLTDEEYFRGGVDAAGGLLKQATAGRPRSFGVTLVYNF
ncbi:MAG: TonB-dependent receptor [Steroidobacteraceae bacterium]